MSGVLNEMITYGVIAINAATPIQSCNETDVVLSYVGPTYAISLNKTELTRYKKKGVVDFEKKLLIHGGYNN